MKKKQEKQGEHKGEGKSTILICSLHGSYVSDNSGFVFKEL